MKKLSVLFIALVALFVWAAPSHAADEVKKADEVTKAPVAHKVKKLEKRVKKDKKELKKDEKGYKIRCEFSWK